MQAPFAAVLGLVVAVEDGYVGWLMLDADPGWGWYLLAPAALALLAVAGAALVWAGRGRGSVVLALAAVLPLLGLVLLLALFTALGSTGSVWWAVLLLVGPLAALVLALQRPVRDWTRRRPAASRPPRGARAR